MYKFPLRSFDKILIIIQVSLKFGVVLHHFIGFL